MIKSISRKTKRLLVALFALVLSITTLVISMPNVKAGEEGDTIYSLSLSNIKNNTDLNTGTGTYGKFSWAGVTDKGKTDIDGEQVSYISAKNAGYSDYSDFKIELDVEDTYKGRILYVSLRITFKSSSDYDYFKNAHFTYGDNSKTQGLGQQINSWGFSDIEKSQYGKMIFKFSDSGVDSTIVGFSIQVNYGDKYATTIKAGTGIDEVFVSDYATSASKPSGTKYLNGTTVYGFVKLKAGFKSKSGWVLVKGYYEDEEGDIYRIGEKTIADGPVDFGTINADYKSITLTPNGNGIDNGPDVTLEYNKAATVPALERTNYVFEGWNTKADGTGTDYTTSLSATDVNTLIASNTNVLYAKWKLSKEIQDVIDLITAIGNNVTYPDSKTAITDAETAYNALSDNTKQGLVSNYSDLTAARSTYDGLRTGAIDNVKDLIDDIGTVVYPNSSNDIVAAEAAYNALDSDDKNTTIIPNYQKLLDARDEYDSQCADKANETVNAIAAINPIISYPKSEKELDNANTLYYGLDDYGKDLVTNYSLLEGYNNQYSTLRGNAVSNVIDLIDAIVTTTPLVYPDVEEKISAARTAFDELGNNDKNAIVIYNYQTLLDAEAVNELVNYINNIGKVEDTDAYREKVSTARANYEALTDDQKDLFPTDVLDGLVDLEKIIDVMDIINAIGDVEFTGESKALIDAANTAYEALDDDLKDDVANYGKLVQANTDYDNVFDVVGMINAIPEFEYTPEFKDIIDNDRNAYDALTDYQKYIFPQDVLDKLLDAEEKYDAIDKITNIGKIENTKESRDRVKKAKEAYDALDEDQKQIVSDEALKDLNDAVAVVDVIEEVNSVKNAGYTTKDKENIDATRTSYNALTDDQKELFPANTLEMLANIETTYPVMVTINQLGNVEYTSEFKNKLDTIKAIYDSLTDSQKALVRNYVVLAVDMQSYTRVDDAYKAIEAIDKVKYNSSSRIAIEDARKCYNKLSNDERLLIKDEEEKLIKAEKKYEKAEHNHNVGMAWVTAICIIFGVVIVATGLWLLIILILKKRKDNDKEEKKNNNKKSKK